MLKLPSIVIVFVFLTNLLLGQEFKFKNDTTKALPVQETNPETKTISKTEEVKQVNTDTNATAGSVLVIPFQTNQYFVNNDAFICKGSNMKSGELNMHIRRSLAAKMVGEVAGVDRTSSIDDKRDLEGLSDAERIYKITQYVAENKPLVAWYQEKPVKNSSNLWGFGKESTANAPKYLNPKNPKGSKHLYYRAQFMKPEIVAKLSKQYGVKTYLFLNHFEMTTHFKDCTDLQNQVSQRDIYVHYTILDANGKFKDGGVVCTSFHSNTNDIKEILKNTLPSISSMIINQVKGFL